MLMAKDKAYSGNKRSVPTIGFLVHNLLGSYQISVLSGMADAAREQGVNLICVAGGEIEARYRFYDKRNVLFELVGPQNVDGLIIASGPLSNFVGTQGLKAFFEKFHPLPIVSLSVQIEGI